MNGLPGETLKKSYCPFQIWPLKTCNKDMSKNITATFKHLKLAADRR